MSGKATPDEQTQDTVRQNQSELRQLEFSDVLLPPEELLVDADSREEVVEVHDSVDEAVEQRGEEGAPARHEHHRVPCHEGDGGVVVEVEEGDLVELLPQQHEPGVEELHKLRRIVPPAHLDQSIVDILDRMDRLAEPAEVVSPEGGNEELVKHIS